MTGLFNLDSENIFTYPCFLVLILYLIITPLTFQDSPADMPWVAICASLTTAFACVFAAVQITREGMTSVTDTSNLTETVENLRTADFHDDTISVNKTVKIWQVAPTESHPDSSSCYSEKTRFITNCPADFARAFGKMVFCFGGMAMFPTIQCDMKRPRHFNKGTVVTPEFLESRNKSKMLN